jgi:hypothetical protein
MIRIGLRLALGLVCLCGTDLMGLDMWDWMISASPLQDDDMLQGDDIFTQPHSQVIFRVADNHSI